MMSRFRKYHNENISCGKVSPVRAKTWLMLLAIAISGNCVAGSLRTSFKISEKIVDGCQITQETPIDFGDLSIAELVGKVPKATGKIEITCTPGMRMNVTLGAGSEATGNQRRMSTTDHHFLSYDIFSDSTYTAPWLPNKTQYYIAHSQDPIIIPFYTKLNTHDGVPGSGKYTDTISFTVIY